MTELAVFKQRIEDGKEDMLRDFAAEVADREDEALQTLADEGVHTEAAFIEHGPEGTYLVTFMEAEDVAAAMETFEDSDHNIDAEFQRVLADALESPEPVAEFEPLYALASADRP